MRTKLKIRNKRRGSAGRLRLRGLCGGRPTRATNAGEYSGLQPELIEYGISAEENERLGLPCGGRITLLVQRLTSTDRSWLTECLEAIEERRCVERHLDLSTGETTLTPVGHFSSLPLGEERLGQCFGPRMQMLLVGAGELARNLAELGLAMDYEVMVTDPRQQFLGQWEGPVVKLVQGMPDDVVQQYASDRRSAVVTLTCPGSRPELTDWSQSSCIDVDRASDIKKTFTF